MNYLASVMTNPETRRILKERLSKGLTQLCIMLLGFGAAWVLVFFWLTLAW